MDRSDRPDRKSRLRKVDWGAVRRSLDDTDLGTPVLVARLHRAVATRLNAGEVVEIDPLKYEAWSAHHKDGVSEIWMRRKA